MSNFNPGDSSVSNELRLSDLHQQMVIYDNKNPSSSFFIPVFVSVSVCDHTPSPPQRCSSSLLAVVFSSQQAWPGSPPSSPPGFCLEFHLCARGSCSPRQPSTGGLDTRTDRTSQTAIWCSKMNILGCTRIIISHQNIMKNIISYQFILKPTEAALDIVIFRLFGLQK